MQMLYILINIYNLRQKHWTVASFSPIPPVQYFFADSKNTERKVNINIAALKTEKRGGASCWGVQRR